MAGCSGRGDQARVNDIAVPYPPNEGYRVVGVDGGPVTRASSGMVTVVPLVLVDPGTHIFAIESQDHKTRFNLTATIEARKEYRIATGADGKPVLLDYTH